MKLATVRGADGPGGTQAAIVEQGRLRPLAAADVGAVLAAGRDLTAAATVAPASELDGADLGPVVPHPGQFVCLGHNFRAHVEEMGRPVPTYPTLFAKSWRTLVGPADDIELPAASDQVDWEAELAVVIGRTVRHADPDEAAAAIAGYTILNDISVRDWQRRTPQWFQGKSFERTTPLGPWLVTADELDPSDLLLRCLVDDRVVQEASTADFIFPPADVVAYVSALTTLDPGDVLSLGTPGGVGASRTPPTFLRPGQVVRTVVDGIGELVNTCVEAAS